MLSTVDLRLIQHGVEEIGEVFPNTYLDLRAVSSVYLELLSQYPPTQAFEKACAIVLGDMLSHAQVIFTTEEYRD